MTITPAEWASIGGVIVGVIGAVSVALYRRRRTQIRGWVLLVGELQDRVDRLHTAVEAAEARASTAIERAAAAEAQARDAQAQATRLGGPARRARRARGGTVEVDRGGCDTARPEHPHRATALPVAAVPGAGHP